MNLVPEWRKTLYFSSDNFQQHVEKQIIFALYYIHTYFILKVVELFSVLTLNGRQSQFEMLCSYK